MINTSNFINLIGRVGLPPKRVNFDNGSSLLEIALATNRSYKDRDGNRVQETEWHKVKAFGPIVDTLEKYVKVGNQLSVVGDLRYRKWTDKYDQKRQTAEIILQSFSFIGSNNNQDAPPEPDGNGQPGNSSNPINTKESAPVKENPPSYAGEFGDPQAVPLANTKHIPF